MSIWKTPLSKLKLMSLTKGATVTLKNNGLLKMSSTVSVHDYYLQVHWFMVHMQWSRKIKNIGGAQVN